MEDKNLKPTTPAGIGGQAVIEGVMMRNKNSYALAVRNPKQEIELVKKELTPITEKFKFLKLPILRGIVSFIDSLITGMKIITLSTEIAMGDEFEEEPSKFEIWLEKKFGEKGTEYLLYVTAIFAMFLGIGLFMLLPTVIVGFLSKFFINHTWALGILEGLTRIIILVLYMLLVSQNKEIKRVYQYHGAEHKTINCYEAGFELTPENVLNHSRFHKRCGTSFLLIVMIVSMIVFFFIRTDIVLYRFLYRILLVPLIAGISYEIIRWAGKSESTLVKIVSYPGICLQKITTAEPDREQAEVAIAAMKEVLDSESK